jgi:dipeptidyl aminopeptidase/acylaminoacyl peptidase
VQEGSALLFDRDTLAPIARIDAPGADAIAISDAWLAYRASSAGGDAIYVRNIANPAAPAAPLQVASQGGAGQLSRPAVDGNILLYGMATPGGSRIVQRVIGTPKQRVLVRSGRLLLFDPSVNGRSFAYVRTDARRSRLMVRRRHSHGPGRVLLSLGRSKGVLWSNALTRPLAHATIVRPSSTSPDASIVGVSRRHPKRLRQHPPRGGGNHRL